MGTASGKEAKSRSNNSNNFNLMMSSSGGDGYHRSAYHAGSWYSANSIELDSTLQSYLNDAVADIGGGGSTNNNNNTSSNNPLRGVICPHAGYSYSGPTAAYSYWHLQEEISRNKQIRRILVLHPSHHVYLEGCAVSGASIIETPVGNLCVDNELRNEMSCPNYGIPQTKRMVMRMMPLLLLLLRIPFELHHGMWQDFVP